MFVSVIDSPSKNLYDQVLAHADVRGTEHPYEECKIRCLDYNELSAGMKSYYLWWRTCILEGKCLKTDLQYLKLFIYESLVLGYDPHIVLNAMQAADENRWVAPAFLQPLAADLCVCKGLPIPQWTVRVDEKLERYLTGVRLASPFRFSCHIVREIGDPFPDHYPDDGPRLNMMVNHALRAIDEYLLQTTGHDFVSTYSEKEEKFVYQPFKYFGPVPGCRPVVLRYPVFANAAKNVFKGVYAYCCKKLSDDGPRVPSDFPKEYRALIDALPMSPSVWDMPDTVLNVEEYSDTSEVGLILPLLERGHTPISNKFKEDIVTNWTLSVEGPLEYVPSGSQRPDYRHLSPEAKQYYFYWRTCLRKGRYPPTDMGYLWLRCCELINAPCDRQEAMDGLYGLVKAYTTNLGPAERMDWGFNRYSIRKVCLEYALFYELPIPDVEMYPCFLSDCYTFERFLETGETPPTETFLIALADLKANQSGSVDRDVTAITDNILFRLEKESKKGIMSEGGVRTKNIKGRIFDGVEFYGFKTRSHSLNVSPMNVFTEGHWRDSIHDLLLSVVAHVRLYKGTSKKKPESCWGFGKNLDKIIDEETKAYFRPTSVAKEVHLDLSKVDDAQKSLDDVTYMLSVPEKKKVKAGVVLDLSKIDAAQKGLDDVTGMMAVPEPEETVEEVPVKPKRGRPRKVKAVEPAPVEKVSEPVGKMNAGSSWGPGLKSRLDEFQTEYLKALSEEPVACPYILRLSKMSRGRMEDSINAVAIEVLGDTLLDGGEIVKEYLDTVKGLFR